MNKDQLLSIVRHALTATGGILVTLGVTAESVSQDLLGGGLLITGVIWALIHNSKPKG